MVPPLGAHPSHRSTINAIAPRSDLDTIAGAVSKSVELSRIKSVPQTSMSEIEIYRQFPRNASASTATKNRKNAPIRRGIHQIELSFTSRAGWAVLAHPRTPSGYSSAQTPTATKHTSTSGNIQRLGATKYAKNVST